MLDAGLRAAREVGKWASAYATSSSLLIVGCVSGESESLRFRFLAGVVELVDRLGMMDNVYRGCIGSDVSNVGMFGKQENSSSCTFRKVAVLIVW